MTFGQAISSSSKKYATFRGRASWSEFWQFLSFGILLLIGAQFVDAVLAAVVNLRIASVLVVLAMLLPQLAVSVRRLHDGLGHVPRAGTH